MAVLAGSAIASALQSYATPLSYVSAAVLAGFGIRGLVTSRKPVAQGAPNARRGELVITYAKFLGLTVVNPLTVVYFTTLVLGLQLDVTATEGVVFAGAAFLASLSWQTLLAGIGAAALRGLPARFQAATGIVGNLVVLSLAVLVVVRAL